MERPSNFVKMKFQRRHLVHFVGSGRIVPVFLTKMHHRKCINTFCNVFPKSSRLMKPFWLLDTNIIFRSVETIFIL